VRALGRIRTATVSVLNRVPLPVGPRGRASQGMRGTGENRTLTPEATGLRPAGLTTCPTVPGVRHSTATANPISGAQQGRVPAKRQSAITAPGNVHATTVGAHFRRRQVVSSTVFRLRSHSWWLCLTWVGAVSRLGGGSGRAGGRRLSDPWVGSSSLLGASWRRSSSGQSGGHSAVISHARPGLCLHRSGYPLAVEPRRSLHSHSTSEERMVRVGRRRSVTTPTGQVAGSSPVAAGRVSAGGVAQGGRAASGGHFHACPNLSQERAGVPSVTWSMAVRVRAPHPGRFAGRGDLLGGVMPPFRRTSPRPLVRTDVGGGGPKRDRLPPFQGALGGGQPE
jgi:hypothetical protein